MNQPRMGDSARLLTILREHFGQRSQLVGAEIGVHRGATSALLLSELPRLVLYMVDPWAAYGADDPYRKSGDACSRFTAAQQQQNREAAELATDFARHRRMILQRTSQEAAGWVSRERTGRTNFHFAFIDGDHTLAAVRQDIACWWPLVRSGGLLCGHDIDHPRDRRGAWGVRMAVEEHERASGVRFGVLGSCWWFVKP
jgi:hypothetical protein